MKRKSNKRRKPNIRLMLLAFTAIGLALAVWVSQNQDDTDKKISTTTDTKQQTADISAPEFDKTTHSLNDPSSLWAVVNKGRKLPPTYTPQSLTVPNVLLRSPRTSQEMRLRDDASRALEQMFEAAQSEGVKLMVTSAHRSFNYQKNVYNGYLASMGKEYTDATSARPGHSEHQTGLAVDVSPSTRKCELDTCFAGTPEGIWVAKNAEKFGFILRYPEGKQQITGYSFEPWHLRFVGNDLASQIYASKLTLEQFFELPTFSDYPQNIYELSSGS